MFPRHVRDLGRMVFERAVAQRVKIITAESCTGGLLAALLTDFPGSSAVFEYGFVTYSNQAKKQFLGVPDNILTTHGAVSQPVACLMAQGALAASSASLAIAVTGIAGPGGGTPLKPVGTVHLACARDNAATVHEQLSLGDIGRERVRMATIEAALTMMRALI